MSDCVRGLAVNDILIFQFIFLMKMSDFICLKSLNYTDRITTFKRKGEEFGRRYGYKLKYGKYR